MPLWMIAFSLGVAMAGIVPELPAARWLPLLLVLPLLSLRLPRLRLAGAFLLGLWWALVAARQAAEDLLPKELERADIWVEGRVLGLPRRGGLSQRFQFQVERWCPRSALRGCIFEDPPRLRRRLLLNQYGEEEMAPAQRWRLKLRLKRPHGFANPGGFDYEAWLFQQKISATGYIREDPGNRLLHDGSGEMSFDRLRHAFRMHLAALFPAGEGALRQAALIKALTIGEHYDITDAQWALFTATGTNHLVVISGLHLSLVALLGYGLFARAARLFPGLLLRVPAPRIGACGALLGAGFYAGLAGFSLPVQRALVMALALMLGRLLRRQTSARNSLCLALGLVLAMDPLAPQNVGFWLSFGAVALLVFLFAGPAPGEQPPGWLRKAGVLVGAQFGLCLGLLPLMLVFFQQTSLLAPLVNLIAIPLVSMLVVPACLVGLGLLWLHPGLARLAFLVADRLLDLLMAGLAQAVEWTPQAVLELPALPPWGLACLAAGVLLLLSTAPLKLRALAPAGLLPLVLAGPERLPEGTFRLHVLDVGQGLATVVETAHHRLVYDTGPAFSPRFDAGSGVLLPFLRARNLSRVDLVIVSHSDLDHAGGLAAVLQRFPQAHYLGGEVEVFPPGVDAAACRAGQAWRWDGVDFAILHPDGVYAKSNDASCVLRIVSGDQTALIPGDIEGGVERLLAARDPQALRADILVAPHHGSRTSSTPGFVRAVDPAWVVYSSGYLNRFGHPAPDVRERYARAGARALNTAETGALSFLVDGEGEIEAPELWRRVRRRWWSSL